jgi:hypothetical protein
VKGICARHRRVSLLVIALGAFTADPAVAQDEGPLPPLSLSYSAGPSCPTQAEFWRQVVGHLRRIPSETLRPFRVEAEEQNGRAVARVAFGAVGAVTATRELLAESCAEAIAAAALVVALAIDEQLAGSIQMPESPARGGSNDLQPLRPAPPAQPEEPARMLVDRRPSTSAGAIGLDWHASAGAVAEYAVAPSPLLGVVASLGVGQRVPSWEARVGFVYARSGGVERRGESAEFVLLGGRADACAFPFLNAERTWLEPCLAVELASVQSSGTSTPAFEGLDDHRLWLAMGPLLRLRRVFAELHLELFAGPWLPIAGTSAFIIQRPGGEATFHEVPAVGWLAGAGLSLAVP